MAFDSSQRGCRNLGREQPIVGRFRCELSDRAQTDVDRIEPVVSRFGYPLKPYLPSGSCSLHPHGLSTWGIPEGKMQLKPERAVHQRINEYSSEVSVGFPSRADADDEHLSCAAFLSRIEDGRFGLMRTV